MDGSPKYLIKTTAPKFLLYWQNRRDSSQENNWLPVWVLSLTYKTVKETADDAKFYVAMATKAAKLRIPQALIKIKMAFVGRKN